MKFFLKSTPAGFVMETQLLNKDIFPVYNIQGRWSRSRRHNREIRFRVAYWTVGQRVGVGWRGGHCLRCKSCLKGEFWLARSPLATGISTTEDMPSYMVPAWMCSPLSQMNLVRGSCTASLRRRNHAWCLKKQRSKGGDLIAIQGFGGLGHLALQFALRLGLKTVVISRGQRKRSIARKLGAQIYIDAGHRERGSRINKARGSTRNLLHRANSKAIGES